MAKFWNELIAVYAQSAGFEPAREDPIGFKAIQALDSLIFKALFLRKLHTS